ncbi:response regulator [Halorubrum sp. DTA98]|uniref:response regulator n=1 Tax=Halorubrum sp. DTA98 TaxID=3402163 RepID=UPI003AAF328A
MNDTPENQRSTVLVVDDERGLADLYAVYLDEDYETRTAYDGETALEQVDDDVDAILLDRRMPGLSGDEVLTALREQGYDCPVAMLTAVDPDEDILKLDVDDYFVKPVDQEEIREAVATLTARTRYNDEFRSYFATVSKKAAMETNLSEQELASSDAYQTLTEEAQAAKEDADAAFTEMMATDQSPFAGFREI